MSLLLLICPYNGAHMYSQYEAIPESLKNVLLVMNASGILVPPAELDTRDQRQKSMWAATQERIDRFIPGFLGEIIPSPLIDVT